MSVARGERARKEADLYAVGEGRELSGPPSGYCCTRYFGSAPSEGEAIGGFWKDK